MIEIGWKATCLLIVSCTIPGVISGNTALTIQGFCLGLWLFWPGFLGMFSDIPTNHANLRMMMWIVGFNVVLILVGSGFLSSSSVNIYLGVIGVVILVPIGLWILSRRPFLTREDVQSSASTAKMEVD